MVVLEGPLQILYLALAFYRKEEVETQRGQSTCPAVVRKTLGRALASEVSVAPMACSSLVSSLGKQGSAFLMTSL